MHQQRKELERNTEVKPPFRGQTLRIRKYERRTVMHDTEVNKRAREVEKELQEMKEQWVKMYELLNKLIDDTTIESEG